MRDKPLIVSLLIGLIVVLVIAGVSLLAKINSLSNVYKEELAKGSQLEKEVEDLKIESASLKENNYLLKEKTESLTSQVEELNIEVKKLEKLKARLEESLKEELMDKKLKKKR